ncbi:Cytochrome P450 6a9, partial [Habropoda laboriosa]
FFRNVVKDTINYRKENNIIRHDFIDRLIELKQHSGKIENVGRVHKMTDALLTSQAFVFFVAGFKTSSSAMAHALYESAQNQGIQDKLREEIRESVEKHGRIITYEQIKEMKYMDKVMKACLPLLNAQRQVPVHHVARRSGEFPRPSVDDIHFILITLNILSPPVTDDHRSPVIGEQRGSQDVKVQFII